MNKQEVSVLFFHTFFFLFKPATSITHNATYPLSDVIRGNLSDNIQLPLGPQKSLYNFFTYAVALA